MTSMRRMSVVGFPISPSWAERVEIMQYLGPKMKCQSGSSVDSAVAVRIIYRLIQPYDLHYKASRLP